ncbi:hypothetical protein KSP39_PZI009814 [Platanthera zijinensis]|uniref:Uncharacterized protein n=1 Tax=Platanthera zijinensis TaxID=2320716 RepID=A0AAP0BHY2_9ASPA
MKFRSCRNAGMAFTSAAWTCGSDLTLHVPPTARSSLMLLCPDGISAVSAPPPF